MNLKSLFLGIMLMACSVSSYSVELLVSEDFSSAAWASEFLRVTPSYVKPATNAIAFRITSPSLYFGKYLLNGYVVTLDGVAPYPNTCVLDGIVHSDGQVAVGFRLTKNDGASYLEFPQLTSAGTITIHYRNCNPTGAANTLILQKNVSGTISNLNTWTILPGNDYTGTKIDQVNTEFNVNSKKPIKLRLKAGTGGHIVIFRVDIESHYKGPLQAAITSANALKTANESNIGYGLGQYTTFATTTFTNAIAAAATVNNTSTATVEEVDAALATLNSATATFQTSIITNVITGEYNQASTLTLTPASNISISDGGELTIDATTSVNNITVEKGGKVTNTSDLTVANIYLLSNESGTGTYVDKGTTHITGTATVQQFLHGASGATERSWWYISFPVTNATSTVFDVANLTPPVNKLWYYNEANDPTPAYTNIATNGTLLNPGRGYVLSLAGNDNTYSFTGSNLNTGDITLTPTRTGTSAVKRGFNLMGNPYPSYLDWNAVGKTNMKTTIWYRTFTLGKQMQFDTFDGEYGTGLGVNGLVNQFIPPLQAFWVRVDSDGSDGSLVLNNNMRYHKDVENNRLKIRALTTAKVLRLKVSNGINGDEALVVTNPNATDGLDGLDSPKMSNDNAAIPEIFTLAGTEEIVINKLKNISTDKEMALGFRTGEYNHFTLSATQLANFDQETKIILKDNLLNTDQDLTDGTSYSFTSDAVTTTSRFSIIFKSASITTELENQDNEDAVNIFKNANNQIVVNQNAASGQQGKVTICNSVGQKLMIAERKGTSTVINKYFPSGIYMVTVNVSGKNITRKVIIN